MSKTWYKPEQVIELELGVSFEDLKTDTPYKVNLPMNEISRSGIDEIIYYLYNNVKNSTSVKFPSSWQWTWIVRKDHENKYVGTLPKRIAKLIYKECGTRLTPSQLAELGNIARRHTIEDESIIFDFTDRLRWKDGDFGDKGSCYWGSNAPARDMLESAGGYGFRLFRQKEEKQLIEHIEALSKLKWICYETREYVTLLTKTFSCPCRICKAAIIDAEMMVNRHGQYINWQDKDIYEILPIFEGIARVWMIKSGKNLITFNGYGKYQTIAVSRLIATVLGHSYKRIELDNEDDMLYLNKDGYIIGRPEDIQDINHVDLKIMGEYEDRIQCAACEDYADETYGTVDGDVCYSCFENYAECGECNIFHPVDNMTEIDYRRLCNECIDRIAETCDVCGELHLECTVDDDGRTICDACND